MRSTARFFILTFVVTWGCYAAALALGFGVPGAPPLRALLTNALLFVGIFAPSLVAIALTAHEQGRAGVGDLLGRVIRPPSQARWLLFAVSVMAAIKLLAALLHHFLVGRWPAFGSTPIALMAGAVLLSTPVQAGEEIGWRGYALPRLTEHMGLGWAGVVLGVVWAGWHLPFFLWFRGSDTYGQSLPLYVLQVTAMSVVMAWVYWRSGGSLLTTMLMHAAANNTKDIVPSAVPGATDPFALSTSLVAWLSVGLLWLLAVAVLILMRKAPRTALREPVG